MRLPAGDVTFFFVEHGAGRPVLVLHGGDVDHREPEASFEPALASVPGLRRIYPDLPGMGRTAAPNSLRSADDVLDALLAFADKITGGTPYLLLGHSAGAYFALGMAERRPDRVAGLALVCPLLPGIRDVPEHRPIIADERLGDQLFRDYFVIHTPEMLDRYERFVAPAAGLADPAASERIGARWELSPHGRSPYRGPTVVVAGHRDSTVGFAAAADYAAQNRRASLVLVDDAGHALPHEQPGAMRDALTAWLAAIPD